MELEVLKGPLREAGLNEEAMEKLIKAAHDMCPYSRATKGNIVSRVSRVREAERPLTPTAFAGGRDQARRELSAERQRRYFRNQICGTASILRAVSSPIPPNRLEVHSVSSADCLGDAGERFLFPSKSKLHKLMT